MFNLLKPPWQLLSGDERQEHERLTLERQDYGRQDHEELDHAAEVHWFTALKRLKALVIGLKALVLNTILPAFL